MNPFPKKEEEIQKPRFITQPEGSIGEIIIPGIDNFRIEKKNMGK